MAPSSLPSRVVSEAAPSPKRAIASGEGRQPHELLAGDPQRAAAGADQLVDREQVEPLDERRPPAVVLGVGGGFRDPGPAVDRHRHQAAIGADELARLLGKVINLENKSRMRCWPNEGALSYVANGEIGIVVGEYKHKNMTWMPRTLEVELSSQPGVAYKFPRGWMSGESGSPPLELAYAITVHKAQGSEFATSFLVIPNPCRLLSRELLYTALTRQRERVVVLYQGDAAGLKELADPRRSVTATRLTNLFDAPKLVKLEDRFLEEGLIHRTERGDAVRSKSEVIIANLLHGKGLDYAYERRLVGDDASVRYPDFTIEDAESGVTVYWEHLGMLSNPDYRDRWERKVEWYRAQGSFRSQRARDLPDNW